MAPSLSRKLEMMDRLYPDRTFQLRLWVVGMQDATTYCNIDWVVVGGPQHRAVAERLASFTWNGELDCARRGTICAMDSLSQVAVNLPPLTVR